MKIREEQGFPRSVKGPIMYDPEGGGEEFDLIQEAGERFWRIILKPLIGYMNNTCSG